MECGVTVYTLKNTLGFPMYFLNQVIFQIISQLSAIPVIAAHTFAQPLERE
jgi:hypothetical protein